MRPKKECTPNVYIEHQILPGTPSIFKGLFQSSVQVPVSFLPLNKITLLNPLNEVISRQEMVAHSVDFSWSWSARSCRNTNGERSPECLEKMFPYRRFPATSRANENKENGS
jgi:hypothetical protein